MGNNWTAAENRIIIADYFEMLKMEIERAPYVKKRHRERLMPRLNGRSESSIERKHQNISAVLLSLSLPFILGYKPLGNAQGLLEKMVIDFLADDRDMDFHFKQFSEEGLAPPKFEEISFEQLKQDPPETNPIERVRRKSQDRRFRKPNYVKIEQDNRALGRSGEKMILEYEKWWLRSRGKDKYADQIEWISEERGDGAGFDILSRYENGKDKLIEVKTTKLSEVTPFYFTRNEMEVSRENRDRYHLYRVYLFAKRPSFFEKRGSFEDICQHYEATNYIGRI